MLTNDEIKAFIEDIEADNVERTVSTSKTDRRGLVSRLD